ncbi:MAG: cytochrome P450, partial [Cyanobacteria bacterium J06632_3]
MTNQTIETVTASQPASPTIDGPKAKGIRQVLRTLRLILQPTKYMDDSVRRYGYMFQIGSESASPLVYVGEPAVVKEIFALANDKVIVGQGNGVLESMVGKQSILLLDGAPHKRQRKLLMPPFHGEQLRAYGQLICDITRNISADWQPGETIVARAPIQNLTLGVILQAVFGQQTEANSEEQTRQQLARLQRLMSTLLDSFAYPITASFLFFPKLQKDWGPWSPWGKFIQLREEVRSLIYAQIRDRRQRLTHLAPEQNKATDILTLLLQARDESGNTMSDEELHDEIVTLLLAGHETIAEAVVS